MDNNKVKQKRVLFLADFACSSGFANVAENIVIELLKDKDTQYMIDIIGINYYGLATEWQKLYPQIRLYPATILSGGDVFGRQGFISMLATGIYDIAFTIQDTFNIEPIGEKIKEIRNKLVENGGKPFKFIFYFPIDATPKENWITKAVSLADIPVVYTQYGFDESVIHDEGLKDRLKIINHGCDTNIFKLLPDAEKIAFREKYFLGLAKDKYLVTNVNRNQPRKDIAKTMQVFRSFKDQVPSSVLYLHMKHNDVAYNLHEVARNFNLIPDEDYIIPTQFDEHDGFPPDIVNAIYNASDLIMTTSRGEGWGLAVTEAMATKTPVIAPDHTSFTEIIGSERGTLVKAGVNQDQWIVMQLDNERLRPLVSVSDYVDKMVSIYNNPEAAKAKAETAYNYLQENWQWSKIGEQWREVFKEAIPMERKIKIGRNDPCPDPSHTEPIKWKNCEVHNVVVPNNAIQ